MAIPPVRNVRVSVSWEVFETVGSPGHVLRLVGLRCYRGRRVLRNVRATPVSLSSGVLRARTYFIGVVRWTRSVLAFSRIFNLIRTFGLFQDRMYRRLQTRISLRQQRRFALVEIRNLNGNGFLRAHVRTCLYHFVTSGGFIHHGGDGGRGVKDQRQHRLFFSSV